MRSVFIKNNKERLKIYFLCISKVLSLLLDDSEIENLIREFYTPSDLMKYFKQKYLACIKKGDHPEYNIY